MKIRALLALFCLNVNAWAAPTPPSAIPGGYQGGGLIRVFADRDLYSLFAETSAVNQTGGRELTEVAAGTYFRLSPGFKLGAIVSRDWGLRHDEDWDLINGKWQWANSKGRGETLIALDATAKSLVDFLPGNDWVAEFKVRYIFNSFNDDRTLMLRPGLTYFYMNAGKLIANFFVRLEVDLPLNYGNESVSEKWIYFGSLYHFSKYVDFGPTVTEGWQTWSSPQFYKERGGGIYSITTQTTTLGLMGVFRF
ncbi:MAG: hypothetical protein ACXVA9_09720 [Bdellovibrionales bacterium]